MKVLTAIGARPQFIKAGPVSKALKTKGIEEIVVHSGQHYDQNMSDLFFEELDLPTPHLNLGVGSGSHAEQTAAMLIGFEKALLQYKPDWVLVHGDTNSTLAAALAAAKLGVRIAHNEAGLRSFNRSMPEEHNRVLVDHCSDLMFCPTMRAVGQLHAEGIVTGVHQVGDVMYDCLLGYREVAVSQSQILNQLSITRGDYVLVTIHRAYNVDVPSRLESLVHSLAETKERFVIPVHPRLKEKLRVSGITLPSNVVATPPLGYLDMLQLEQNARLILTDSGGVQKEAYMLKIPCITVRPETEWMETVEAGWNRLTDVDEHEIIDALTTNWWPEAHPELFGDGTAAQAIAAILFEH